MPVAEKEFVLKHVLENVSNMKDDVRNFSKIEEHFGIPWKIGVKRNKDHLGMYLYCKKKKTGKEWSIKVSDNMKIYSVNGKQFSKSGEDEFRSTEKGTGWGFHEFMKWDEMMKDYVIDNTLNVEIHVKIEKVTGFEKKKLMDFDESMKEFSDVVLVVENQKFYVSKLFLARQSTYFEAMFLRNFQESKKEEVTLTGIKAEDFQNYLEILHSKPSIDDDTVAGIVHLADMYDTKAVIRLCEEFLMKESEKSAKEKLELAAKYKLEMLKTKCLIGINTIDDIRSVLPGNLRQMDHSLLAELLEKVVSQPN